MQNKRIIWRGQPAAERVARNLSERERLNREYEMLTLFGGVHAPKVLCYENSAGSVRLVRSWLEGSTLDQVTHCERAQLIIRLRVMLWKIHQAGWIHGDLKPENIVSASTGPVLIDWEHAAPIGAEVSRLSARAVTIGMTHPDLIWGRGHVRSRFDIYALDQIAAVSIDYSGFIRQH
ncbi:RIO1 family regulatory kinase/ATPase [uncultured Planktomarina sp.]|uniref:RIO1 family regulatory kinase/ATPase domain-containing protein n=1 Tax=uncultured Planktomarina sp. TaxID=1538529 RepID=UPI003261C8E7|tara:strand:+ start:139 stop:669 length:531 start_codon:yes stop_codon:yes gene_type:complete